MAVCNCATISSILKVSIGISCLFVFVVTTVAGIILILAPEEPSLDLGGGSVYSLSCGIALLALAGITVVSSVFGCICVSRDSGIGLCLYSLLIVLIAVLVTASASVLAGFTYSGMAETQLNHTLWKSLKRSSSNGSMEFFEIQANYSCCGVDSSLDWCKGEANWKYCNLPSSCCGNIEPNEPNQNCTQTNSFSKGCSEVLLNRLEYVVDTSFSVAIVGVFLLLFTSCLTAYGSSVISKYQNYDIL